MTGKTSLPSFDKLQADIGHHFDDLSLLQMALTHKSAPTAMGAHYERLEFLGDRILGQAVSHALYTHFKDEDQGKLTKRFHALVQQNALAKIAHTLGLDSLIITDGTKQAASQDSVLSDVIEAIIAALYLDGGQKAADQFITRFIDITKTSADDGHLNPKSALQEWVMARKWPLPKYQAIETSGPDHSPIFVIEVSTDTGHKARGEGTSKKEAEQKAARELLRELKQKEIS